MIGLYDFIIEKLDKSKIVHRGEMTPEEEIKDLIMSSGIQEIKKVYVDKSSYSGNEYWVFIDFLEKKDWPNNIQANTIYAEFHINTGTGKVELYKTGHIYLSHSEMKEKNMAMASWNRLVEKQGGKKFRKTPFKSLEQCVEKITVWLKPAVDILLKSTDGYPYRRLKEGVKVY